MEIPTLTHDIPETKLGGKFAGAGSANTPRLMELLYKAARQNDLKDTLTDGLIGTARRMGISDETIIDALYENADGPVFYYP